MTVAMLSNLAKRRAQAGIRLYRQDDMDPRIVLYHLPLRRRSFMNRHNESANWSTQDYAVVMGIAIGAGLGMLFGLLLGNIAVGIGAGVVVGFLVGSVVQTQGSAKDKKS
ncbi:MAG TPA: hypothetical protein VNI34_05585 [Candidatus Nitrosotalea sp.]|nr:hypothetical protein [Candidatus Nitrosotalea sp.]